MRNIKLKKNKENPETPEVLADAIIKISNSLEQLSKLSGLNERALITLVQDSCSMVGNRFNRKPISRSTVEVVFRALKELKGRYCRNK